jgi:hypothetical protein
MPAWKTYVSADYGFSVRYPTSLSFYRGDLDYKETQMSYIPICDYTTVACFEYNGMEYKDTTFEAAGFSINVLRDIKTESDCGKIDTGQYPIQTENINGIKFRRGLTGEGATSHSKGGPTYRTFHQSVCFEIAAATAQVSIGAFDPGAIKAFDSARVDKLLDKVIHTFRFVGPVKDGPGWKVYYDGMCGGIYEYPESATIRTTIEYTNERFDSKEITCSRYFTDHGRDYTIAAKVNLRDKEAVDNWLRSSGYPDLAKAQMVKSSKYYTEYKAETSYYIYGQTVLYILSVSDAKHQVIAAHDTVFTHLLNSFKAD